MLMGKLTHWTVIFATLAALYAVLGFGGAAGSGADIAKILSIVLLSASIATLAGGWVKKNH